MDIKRCPFCGGIAALYIDDLNGQGYVTARGGVRRFPHLHFIKCGACDVSTGRFEVPDMAIAAWNRRINDDHID